MPILPLVFAPNPIFRQKAEAVAAVDEAVRQLVADMFETVAANHGVGMGANMVGVLKRIAVIDLPEEDGGKRYALINPEITWRSDETQTVEEASLCFPGISAPITRSKAIRVIYLDEEGKKQELEAEGFLATVIQHEVDYLDGVTFLDYLSKMKRDTLMRKMQKHIRLHGTQGHVHGPHCHHG